MLSKAHLTSHSRCLALSQFENALQTSTHFQTVFLEYFGVISFHYPSNKLWNFFKNTEFIISHTVSSQPTPQAEVFYIDGTKNAKAAFWSFKEYKVFYTKLNSAQENEIYALIQVICLHSYPVYIVSDSLYSVFVLKNIETSTINSNQPIIQQLFFKLQSVIRNCNSPIYITHMWAHSYLPGPMTHGNEQTDKLVSFATLEEQHALLYTNAGSLHQPWKIPYHQAKEIINNCSTCRSMHLWPSAQGKNPHGLEPNELWQMDVTNCPELSPSSFLHICIDTKSSFIWATPFHSEGTQHLITHLLTRFAVMGMSSSIKTDNGPAYVSRHFKQFLQSFSIKHITGIPYNAQAQGIVERALHTLNLQINKLKKGGIHRNTTVFLI